MGTSSKNSVQDKQKKPETAKGMGREPKEVPADKLIFPAAATDLLQDSRVPKINRQQIAQQMSLIHGNKAVRRLLDPRTRDQRLESSSSVVQRDLLGGVTDIAINAIFRQVVNSNISDSSTISIPDDWPGIVREYATANPDDSAVLTAALGRSPAYHSGGWIMDIQQGAKAMTLDRDIFVRGSLNLKTYVHELVHVTQYGQGSPTDFLVSYFGQSAVTIARRLINREPLQMMRSSPHEEAAYQLGDRFATWYQETHSADSRTVTPG